MGPAFSSFISSRRRSGRCTMLAPAGFREMTEPNAPYGPSGSYRPMADCWPEILDGDYQAAVIRLATLTENHTQYLLFASFELYPAEIELPPPKVNLQRRNAGNSTATIGIATLSVQDALAWHEGAIGGSLRSRESQSKCRSPSPGFQRSPGSVGCYCPTTSPLSGTGMVGCGLTASFP